MHFVQTLILFVPPSFTTLILCRLGSHSFFVRLCAWLTLYPICFPFPHISQTLAIATPIPRYIVLLSMQRGK